VNNLSVISKRACLTKIKPYVPGKPVEEVERELGLKQVIKLASNENPLGPSSKALQVLREALASINQYPDGNCYYLKTALAENLGIKDTNIIVGNGSDEIIGFITSTFLNAGEEVIYGNPSFSEYDFATCLMGGLAKPVPLKDYRYDLTAMKEAVTERTRIIFICNPNNPTGTIVLQEEVDDFLKDIPPHVLVVFDEAYNEYVTHPQYPRSIDYLQEYKNVIILRTFSKIYGLAGLRVGYAVACEEIISSLYSVREPFNVNSLAQKGAAAALADKEHLAKSRRVNEEGKEFLTREFTALGLPFIPTEANFIFVDTGVDAVALFKCLLQKGVIIRSGDIFGLPTFIRVTIGTREENEMFIKALKEALSEISAKN